MSERKRHLFCSFDPGPPISEQELETLRHLLDELVLGQELEFLAAWITTLKDNHEPVCSKRNVVGR